MDSLNRNTMTPNMHQQLQSTMKLPTSVQNGNQPIGPYINDASKKQFQPPPPTSIPESTGDIDIDTESKKSLLEVNQPQRIGIVNAVSNKPILLSTGIYFSDNDIELRSKDHLSIS